MNKKISLGAAISMMALTAAIAITLTAMFVMNSLNVSISDFWQRASMFKKMQQVDSLVRSQYVGNIDDTSITDGTIEGYMKGLGDKYGAYLNIDACNRIKQSNSSKAIGIGIIAVKGEDSYIEVVSVVSGSPAEAAGIKSGDEIALINGQDVKTIGYAAAINLLQGSEGTTAEFTVLRNDQTIPFSIVRKKYTYSTVQSKKIGNLGYIRITEFNSGTSKEFSDQVDSLIKDGAKGLIFDVRNNPGGQLDAVVPMIDKLVPEGPIVRAKYKDGTIKVLYTSSSSQVSLPMTVITNKYTASAAELFTAALRDYNKAKSVGEKTYGKGTMQKIFDLKDGTALDLSMAYFYPPKSDNFEGKGITPDIVSAMEKSDVTVIGNEDEDTQLQAAMSYIEMQIK